ncbi:MAG TPA: hypothetical protein VNI60_03520 [Pyrinomonadaceae bacterium]|nr:hypothetical protein [Pyrinomonadaceae bacterium]
MHDESKNSIPVVSATQMENDTRLNMLYGIGSILASAETIAQTNGSRTRKAARK